VHCVDLTDDELWRAIAENTNAMSELVFRQLEFDAKIGEVDPASRANLMRAHLEAANRHQREYRDYTSELRRRHPEAKGQPYCG